MSNPRVIVTNYGVGNNSVLVVNHAILKGIVDNHLLADGGDLVYRPENHPQGNNGRYGYDKIAADAYLQYLQNHPAPDVIVAQACFARGIFHISRERTPHTLRVLQRDSTHAKTWKDLIDGEYKRVGLDIEMSEQLVNHESGEYDLAHRITVLSRWVQRSFQMRGLGHKVHYVGPQVIDLDQWKPRPRTPDGVDFRVLCNGQMRVLKGTHNLLRAWRMLKPRKTDELCFSGFITEKGDEKKFLEDELQAAMDETGGRVKVLGWGPIDQMPNRYASSDVYCLPSIQEGSSMTCVEALAMAKPIVCTSNCGSDLLERYNGRLGIMVPAGEIEPLAEALDEYRSNINRAMKDGIFGRAVVTDEIGGIQRFGTDYATAIKKLWSDYLAAGRPKDW